MVQFAFTDPGFEEFEKENLKELEKFHHEEREEIYLISVERDLEIQDAIFIFENR